MAEQTSSGLWSKAQRFRGLLAKEKINSTKLKNEVTFLQRENEKLKSDVAENATIKFNNTRTPYLQLARASRYRKRQKLHSYCKSFVANLPKDVKVCKVNMSFEGGGHCAFRFPPKPLSRYQRHSEKQAQPPTTPTKEPNDILISSVLCVKDKYMISDLALHKLKRCIPQAPTLDQIKNLRKELNAFLPIQTKDNCDYAGRYVVDVVKHFLNHPDNLHIMEPDTPEILIRFATDGSRLAKTMDSVRGVLQLVTERHGFLPSRKPQDEVTVFFYIGAETRENQECFAATTFSEMKQLQEEGLYHQGKHVSIEFIIVSDWKAVQILTGLTAPISKEGWCIWCQCSKAQISDFSIPSWDITRSLEQSSQYSRMPSNASIIKGYKLPSLLHIEFNKIIPDTLHLRIRLATKLLNQVVSWAIDQRRQKELLAEMKRIKCHFRFWDERSDSDNSRSVTKWYQPSGCDLWKIIGQFQISNVLLPQMDRRLVTIDSLSMAQLRKELQQRGLSAKGKKKADLVHRLTEQLGVGCKLPKESRLRISYDFQEEELQEEDLNILDIDALQTLWGNFHKLMLALKARPGDQDYLDANNFKAEARLWASCFRDLTWSDDVTPYLHTLVYHTSHFLEQYGYIDDIATHQVERKNYDQRVAYFAATQRGGGRHPVKISVQILQRENRLLYAHLKQRT